VIKPIIAIKGGNFKKNGITIDPSGTYVHHLIIPYIAAWTSEEFAIKISIITNNYITN